MSTTTDTPKVAPLVELLGVLVLVVGAGFIVAAAALVSTALACLAAGVFLIVGGIVAVYVASVLDRPEPKKPGAA
jgi:uncharacterized membrane protein HdeD (DUF308 family)